MKFFRSSSADNQKNYEQNNSTCEAHALLIYYVLCATEDHVEFFALGKSMLTLLIVLHRIHKKSVIMKTSCLDYSILPKANGLKNFPVLKKHTEVDIVNCSLM